MGILSNLKKGAQASMIEAVNNGAAGGTFKPKVLKQWKEACEEIYPEKSDWVLNNIVGTYLKAPKSSPISITAIETLESITLKSLKKDFASAIKGPENQELKDIIERKIPELAKARFDILTPHLDKAFDASIKDAMPIAAYVARTGNDAEKTKAAGKILNNIENYKQALRQAPQTTEKDVSSKVLECLNPVLLYLPKTSPGAIKAIEIWKENVAVIVDVQKGGSLTDAAKKMFELALESPEGAVSGQKAAYSAWAEILDTLKDTNANKAWETARHNWYEAKKMDNEEFTTFAQAVSDKLWPFKHAEDNTNANRLKTEYNL